jgi:hypothetical protein
MWRVIKMKCEDCQEEIKDEKALKYEWTICEDCAENRGLQACYEMEREAARLDWEMQDAGTNFDGGDY